MTVNNSQITTVKIKVKKLPHYDNSFDLPKYETLYAAGADLRAQLGKNEKILIKIGEKILVPTGLCLEIPSGYELQIRPRSGLSFKTGLMVINSPGTIDSDYRGELKILLGNLGTKDEIIEHGDRMAQGVLAPVIQAVYEEVQDLAESQRGSGGFGSTGVK